VAWQLRRVARRRLWRVLWRHRHPVDIGVDVDTGSMRVGLTQARWRRTTFLRGLWSHGGLGEEDRKSPGRERGGAKKKQFPKRGHARVRATNDVVADPRGQVNRRVQSTTLPPATSTRDPMDYDTISSINYSPPLFLSDVSRPGRVPS
jgi:hypothetical protein